MINCVVSRYNKNVDWVYKLKNINKVYIYEKEKPECEFNIPVNKGNEASVYLKYIIDNYNNLTDFTFFTHDDEYAWHHIGSIIDRFDDAVNSNELYYNINDNCVMILNMFHHCHELLEWYNTYIEKYIPLHLLTNGNDDIFSSHKGSAQFLVHKSLIQNLPLVFYKELYDWITTTNLDNSISGRYLEWTWHIFWVLYPALP